MSTAEGRGANATTCSPPLELVAVEGIAKRYARQVALEDLSLNLRAGEVLGLVGANGGGKTTTQRILAGILKPDRGRGEVLGFDVMRGAAQIREHVGYMSQRFSLYSNLTVLENLRFRSEIYGLHDPRAAVENAMSEFQLAPYACAQAQELSGGWARRLQLAAALIHSPKVIFLDEPTAGLDAVSRYDVWRRIERLAGNGAGVIVSSHDLGEAERCSRAALLSEGRVIVSGTPEQIVQSTSAIAVLFSGLEARAFQQSIERTAGVIASYPQGESLRIIALPELGEPLADTAGARRLRLTRAPMRFEDAVLARLHDHADEQSVAS